MEGQAIEGGVPCDLKDFLTCHPAQKYISQLPNLGKHEVFLHWFHISKHMSILIKNT